MAPVVAQMEAIGGDMAWAGRQISERIGKRPAYRIDRLARRDAAIVRLGEFYTAELAKSHYPAPSDRVLSEKIKAGAAPMRKRSGKRTAASAARQRLMVPCAD